MALRHFRDGDGNEWRVWDVIPYALPQERRRTDRRRIPPPPYSGPERRRAIDRRRRTPELLTPGLEGGWLCFENEADKRRLTPIPPGWEQVEDGELHGWLERAKAVGRRLGQR